MIVVAFGGSYQRDYQPDAPEDFESRPPTCVVCGDGHGRLPAATFQLS